MFHNFSQYISTITTISVDIVSSLLMTIFTLAFFSLLKMISSRIIRKKLTGRGEYVLNQSSKVFINIMEILILLLIWGSYIRNLMTLISIVSAAMTISLRELILNFFSGIYIKVRRPFKVEDRIQIDDIKGDVMNISSLSFELLEVSSKDENGQSTGIVVSFPNSVVLSRPLKNINRGFKYVWNELVVKVKLDCDLSKNKQEIYKIVNSLETIKSIPRKMKSLISEINPDNRIYFNKYDPIIYTKIVDDHIELTVRYLMHPKKSRYVESVIWNKIYLAYKDNKIDLYTSTN